MNQPKSAHLSVRLQPVVRSQFHAKALQYGQPSEVLRELVEAFIEGRLIIQAPVKRNLEGLYK